MQSFIKERKKNPCRVVLVDYIFEIVFNQNRNVIYGLKDNKTMKIYMVVYVCFFLQTAFAYNAIKCNRKVMMLHTFQMDNGSNSRTMRWPVILSVIVEKDCMDVVRNCYFRWLLLLLASELWMLNTIWINFR